METVPPGATFGNYEIIRPLGGGGMGAVFLVRHRDLGSEHALKVLRDPRRDLRARARREGQVQARLRGPNIVAATDFIDVNGHPGLIMEYVAGPTLERWLDSHRPSVEEAECLFLGIVAAVQVAHAGGVVHRDLKPANVLMAVHDGRWVPKVTDFGIAKLTDAEPGEERFTSNAPMGSFGYMPPEQMSNPRQADHRADIFSLGCILYELLSGSRAFPGTDLVDLGIAMRRADFVPLDRAVPGVPARFVLTVRRCLEPNADHRFQSCDEVIAAIQGRGAPVVDRSTQVPFVGEDDAADPIVESAAIDTFAPAPAGSRGSWARSSALGFLLLAGALGSWWTLREPADVLAVPEADPVAAQPSPALAVEPTVAADADVAPVVAAPTEVVADSAPPKSPATRTDAGRRSSVAGDVRGAPVESVTVSVPVSELVSPPVVVPETPSADPSPRGRAEISGAPAEIWTAGGARAEASALPLGAYELRANFGAGFTNKGSFSVTSDGQVIRYKCTKRPDSTDGACTKLR